MAFLDKLKSALKSFSFSGYSGGPFHRTIVSPLPGTRTDYTGKAGELWLNGVVSICLRWLGDNFTEPDLVVEKRWGKDPKPNPQHPMLQLLANPNPYYDEITLFHSVLLSFLTDGNAYLYKVRSDDKQVAQLYWIPHWEVFPVRNNDHDFVSYYQRRSQTGQSQQDIPVEDLIHFRWGLDPLNQMVGMSPLKAQLREIVGDNAASTYSTAVLLNMGVAPFMLMPGDKDATIDPDQAQSFKDKMRRNTGDGAAEPVVFSSPMNIVKLGMSPEDMALDKIRSVPEDRICAAMGLNAMALGLTSGANAKTYANYETALAAAYQSGLMPLQTKIAETLYRQLLPEFEEDTSRFKVRWDYSKVPALAEDQESVVNRAVVLWTNDLATRATVKSLLGFEFSEEDDVYYSELAKPVPVPTVVPDGVTEPTDTLPANG